MSTQGLKIQKMFPLALTLIFVFTLSKLPKLCLAQRDAAEVTCCLFDLNAEMGHLTEQLLSQQISCVLTTKQQMCVMTCVLQFDSVNCVIKMSRPEADLTDIILTSASH